MALKSGFRGYSVVCCGTLRPEMRMLQQSGFLDADRILFTAPGLHERPPELAAQLTRQLGKARETSGEVIVLYGSKCYLDPGGPAADVDALIGDPQGRTHRVQAKNCVDMLADIGQRDEIAAGQRVYWLTPGWVVHWKRIFRDWDAGKANEAFPQHDRAVVLDGIGFFEDYLNDNPDELLGFSDWMKVPIEAVPVSLDRFKGHLTAARAAGTDVIPGENQ